MAAPLAPENFIKTLQALQHVRQKAVHSVEKTVYTWHSCQKQSGDQRPCRQPQVCSTKGKPKSNGSCDECVEWGRTIEAVYYPQPAFVAWKNINPTLLYGSAIEVCNAFALHLPAGQRPTKVSDYDTASILKIMLGFGEFHQNNLATVSFPDPYHTIQKVSDIRNNLSHYPMNENLYMSEQTLNEHFQDIRDFVQCLEELHHFTQQQGDEIRAELDEIQKSPATLTSEMEEVINDSMRKGLQEQADQMETSLADALEIILKEIIVIKDCAVKQDSEACPGKSPGMKKMSDKDILDVTVRAGLKIDELEILYVMLGLASNEVENAEFMEQSKGVKSYMLQAAGVLRYWRQTKGNAATRNEIINALNICGLDEAKKFLQEEWGIESASDSPGIESRMKYQRAIGSGKKAFDESKQLAEKTRQEVIVIQDHVAKKDSEAKLREETLKWRKRLKAKYKQDRRMIRFGRSRNDVADTDDIFVDLALLEEKEDDKAQNQDDKAQNQDDKAQNQDDKAQNQDDKAQNQDGDSNDKVSKFRKLNSYEDLLTFEMTNKKSAHHILLRGSAGCGKTTLLSRIACMWAADNVQSGQGESPWDRFQLVFVVEIRKIISGDSLEQVIQKQLLPGVSVECIANVVSMLGKKCLILLDGFDEMPKDIDDSALDSPLMSDCFVIVTTRPHMVDEFCRGPGKSVYLLVQLAGFTPENSKRYIEKFFNKIGQSGLAVTLIERLEEIPVFQTLSSFPILLVMTCLLWEDARKKEKPFKTMTSLYQEAVVYLNKPFEKKCQVPPTQKTESILVHLGRAALEALFTNSLQIKYDLFDENVLEQSVQIGLNIKEDGALLNETYISFIHKTFQEFCAAKHLVHLFQVNIAAFHSYLKRINDLNLLDMEYLLRFSCGLSSLAGEKILNHCLNVGVLRLHSRFYNHRNSAFLILLLYEAVINSPSEESAKLCKILDYMHDQDLAIDGAEKMLAFSHLADLELNNTRLWFQEIKNVQIINCKIKGSSFVSILNCTKFLQFLTLSAVDLTVGYNAITSLLACIPSQAKVDFTKVTFSDGSNGGISLSCAPHEKFVMTGTYGKWSTVSTNLVVQLIGWMSSCTSVELTWLETDEVESDIFADEHNIDRFQKLNNLQDFHVKFCHFNTNAITSLLGCIPSQAKIEFTKVTFSDESNGGISFSYVSHGNFEMTGPYRTLSTVRANSVVQLIRCMSCTSVKLTWLELTGEVENNILHRVQSIKELQICGSFSAKTLFRLLYCMPSVTNIKLGNFKERDPHSSDLNPVFTNTSVDLKGNDDVDEGSILPFCQSLQEFQMRGSLTANTMIRLLGCMPLINKLTLIEIDFVGNVDGRRIPVCKFLKKVSIEGSSVSAHILISLLCSMRFVQTLLLPKFNVLGTLNIDTIPLLEFLEEFEMSGSINSNVMLTLLNSMPALFIIKLNPVEFKCEVDRNTLRTCKLLRKVEIGGSMSANTMVKLLSCMSSVTRLCFSLINIIGEIDSPFHLPLEFKKFEMSGSMNFNVLLTLLNSMPSVLTIKLNPIELIGEVDRNVLPVCNTLREVQIGGSISANTLIKLLSCMPSITRLYFHHINIVGQLSSMILPLQTSLKEFQIEGSFSIKNIMFLLTCMPVLANLTLCQFLPSSKLDEDIQTMCKSVKVFQMLGLHGSVSRTEASILMTLLRCMPSVITVRLSMVEIDGDIDDKMLSSLKSISNFVLRGSVRGITLIQLLNCMPAVKVVYLTSFNFKNKVGRVMSPSDKPLGEFQMAYCQNVNKFKHLLSYLPSAITLSMHGLTTMGNDSMLSIHKQFKEYQRNVLVFPLTLTNNILLGLLSSKPVSSVNLDGIKLVNEFKGSKVPLFLHVKHLHINGSLSLHMLLTLLRCMPYLETAKLQVMLGTHITCNILPTCNLLSDFQIENIGHAMDAISPRQLFGLLRCMPSVARVKLSNFSLNDETYEDICVSCKLLKVYEMKGTKHALSTLSSSMIMRLFACMPSVLEIQLSFVKLTGKVDASISPVCQLLTKFQTKGSLMSSCSMVKLLECMPSIKELKLDSIKLQGEVEESIQPLCNSLKEFYIGGSCEDVSILSANTMIKLLSCMPSVTKVILDCIKLTGEVSECISPTCESLTKFNMGGSCGNFCTISSKTLMVLLRCMQSVTDVKLYYVNVTGEIDRNKLPSLKSLKKFLWHGSFGNYCAVSASTFVRVLGCMSLVTSVKLEFVHLTGEIRGGLSASCQSLKEFHMTGSCGVLCSMNANVLIKLLLCIPQVETVTLHVELIGEVDRSLSPYLKLLKKFQVRGIMRVSTMMKLVDSMPSITKREIDAELTDIDETERIKLILENNELFLGNIGMKSGKLKSSMMGPLSSVSVSTKTLFKLMLICLPFETLIISDIDLVDKEGAVSSYFGSIRQFQMSGSLSINTMMTILACLSSVTTVKFTPVHLIGDVDEHIPIKCEKLTEFHLGCLHDDQICSLSWKSMMMLLKFMPSLAVLKLCHVALTGEVDYSRTPACVSLKELLLEGSLTTNILMWVMKCIPSVLVVKLALYELEGEVNASFSPICASLREFHILGSQKDVSCVVNANTIMKLLGSMPSLEMVTFDKVSVTGKVDVWTSLALKCLEHITISACNLTFEIQSLLFSGQRILTSLRWIRHHSQLSVEEMLPAFVGTHSSSLEKLELDDSTLPRNADGLHVQVVKFLEKQLPYLQELSLSNSHLTEVHCTQLFTLIQIACENVLDTTTSRPGMSNECLPLQWLDVSSCKISNVLFTLTKASQYMHHLKGLILRDCGLNEDNFKELDISLTNIKPKVLDISGNKNISSMFSSNSDYLSSLVVLKLANTNLTDDDVRSLPLSKLSNLAEFDLSNNHIRSNGAKLLAMSLHRQSVRQSNQVADVANVFDRSFHCLPSLERLNLSGNSIASAGASVLAMSFQHLPLLKELNLSSNKPIGPYAVQDIFKQLVHVSHLNTLGLDDIVLVRQECDQLPLLKAILHEISWWNVSMSLGITNEVRLFTLDADQIKAVLQLVFY